MMNERICREYCAAIRADNQKCLPTYSKAVRGTDTDGSALITLKPTSNNGVIEQ